MILRNFWKFSVRFGSVFMFGFPILGFFITNSNFKIGQQIVKIIVEQPFNLFGLFSKLENVNSSFIVIIFALLFSFLTGLKWAIIVFVIKEGVISIFKKRKIKEDMDLLDSDEL